MYAARERREYNVPLNLIYLCFFKIQIMTRAFNCRLDADTRYTKIWRVSELGATPREGALIGEFCRRAIEGFGTPSHESKAAESVWNEGQEEPRAFLGPTALIGGRDAPQHETAPE